MLGNSSTNFSSQEQEVVLHVLLGLNVKSINVIRSYENKGVLIISFDSSKISTLGRAFDRTALVKILSLEILGKF